MLDSLSYMILLLIESDMYIFECCLYQRTYIHMHKCTIYIFKGLRCGYPRSDDGVMKRALKITQTCGGRKHN